MNRLHLAVVLVAGWVAQAAGAAEDWIYFASNRSPDARFHLYRMETDGSNIEQLTFDSAFDDNTPRVSPDGAWVVFQRQQLPGVDQNEIWILPAAGGTPTQITADTGYNSVLPWWSPQGDSLVFQRGIPIAGGGNIPGATRTWVMEVTNGVPTSAPVLVPSSRETHWPTWSQDGVDLLQGCKTGGVNPFEICRQVRATGAEETVVPHSGGEYQPVYAPDGDSLLWLSFRVSQAGDLFVADRGGNGPRRLTPVSGWNMGVWSADGSQVLMRGQNDLDIYRIDRDGSGLVNLTNDPANIYRHPWWAVIPAPNAPPVADAGDDRTVECASAGGTAVSLDGSDSSDPDGDELTYAWRSNEATFDDPASSSPVAVFSHSGTASLTVIDPSGATHTDEVVVEIVDTTPPSLSASVEPAVLWPPNHACHEVQVAVAVADACDPSPSVDVIVFSSEADDAKGGGDGKTVGDVRVVSGVGERLSTNADHTVAIDPATERLFLRAERAGSGDGRTYWVVVTAADADGNTRIDSVGVFVPHSAAGKTAGLPAAPRALGNAPNPFNPNTHIHFELSEPARVKVEVTDILGRVVRRLTDSRLSAGQHWVEWDGRDANGRRAGSGVYLYRVWTGGEPLTGRMLLLR